MFLDLEICLSRRSDLIMPVLERAFALQPPGLENENVDIVAHTVDLVPVVKLNFLVCNLHAAETLRPNLIVAGELMLDDIFARSPWQRESLILHGDYVLPARLEIYVKCRSVGDAAWFERRGIQTTDIALVRSTTAALGDLRLDRRRFKTLLPLLVARTCLSQGVASDGRSQAQGRALSATDGEWLKMRLAHLRKQGLLSSPLRELRGDDWHCLSGLERTITQIADATRIHPSVVIRCVLRQLGYAGLEEEYLFSIGLAIRDDATLAETRA
jgi:hypothetical protein